MRVTHQSFSEVVSCLQNDKEKGIKILVDCVDQYQNSKIEIEELEGKLNRKIVANDSIRDTAQYICQHLNITVPFIISHHKGNAYTIGDDYNLQIIKSDVTI